MDKCECWGNLLTWQYCDGASKICSCGGNKSKCDFYPEKRKEGKMMNTAEMWLKASKDGKTYKSKDVRYNKKDGFHDIKGCSWTARASDYVDDIFKLEWELKPDNEMTKAEAEAKFNIKIVGD